ncbi:phosphatidylinositol-glycan biosynthesis class F protein [Aphidius gifuensis]|uniref:phosphatidylinositol-glycan biosynthesis class F protein n=1 Tax=Aphidius gifuensis TaxID=684658 RepID=UPI001CDD3719|nr:phosphatidylinositol-glycan biosynthesis class F protein [Aphidius gifuensis]
MFEKLPGQRLLLYYCSFTCIYFPCILLLLKFNENIYNIGKYQSIPILLVLIFAELIKLIFHWIYNEQSLYLKIDSRLLSKSRKPWSRTLKEVIKFTVLTILISLIYYIIIVLFGAPLSSHREETTMLSITLTTLTFIAPCLHLGVDTTLGLLSKLNAKNDNIIVDAICLNIKLTLLGCWLGAIVIPLDWDRPWQEWPISCIIGSFFGYMIAHFITFIKVIPIKKYFKSNTKLHR